ncbi:MAG: T9SS type A sorting domain-containing protein [Chlorobi bacterium]|nr:T9SS type A sorting domain-containing protein [Chlorobiota bacterium]MBX7216076.1 T9SS type A sorting domain-containing protein [Candidatus Kapabacteria bacterium]
MMHRIFTIASLFFLAAASLSAQVTIIDSMNVRSEHPSDIPIYARFGVGQQYHDWVDGRTDYEVPFFPPSGLYLLFQHQIDSGSPAEGLCIADVRGIPAAALEGEGDTFSVTYRLRIQRGVGRNLIFSFPRPFARGIDSIVVTDLNNVYYAHTFTAGVAEDTLKNDGVSSVYLKAYFNIRRYNSAVEERGVLAAGRFAPNPTNGRLRYSEPLPIGSHIQICNMMGEMVETGQVNNPAEAVELTNIPAGSYVVTVLTRDGRLWDREQIVVVR